VVHAVILASPVGCKCDHSLFAGVSHAEPTTTHLDFGGVVLTSFGIKASSVASCLLVGGAMAGPPVVEGGLTQVVEWVTERLADLDAQGVLKEARDGGGAGGGWGVGLGVV
jgi:hypothetical protein